MTILVWMVGGILFLNLVRLCLAIRANRKTTRANDMLEAQQIRWNQMCSDVTDWARGLSKERLDA